MLGLSVYNPTTMVMSCPTYLESIVCAAHYENPVEAQRSYHCDVGCVTDKVDLTHARIVVDDLWWFHDDQGHQYANLDGNECRSNDQLGTGTHESWLSGADLLLATRQDTSNAVGLGDQRRVHHSRGEADTYSLSVAGCTCWLCDQRECTCIAQPSTCQYDEAELSTRGLHHRCVSESSEDQGDKSCGKDTSTCKCHSGHDLWVTPL